ncbi:hypothetical protein DdX_18621 [Ditylenchus destructor]|uniref:Uncharacterized protein n=1 Tax=Ditylenchus destructor TaxID=166010 RepID=A0AAD4MJD0_9BILA|nr:hypothetical protein DdX_18621 [Ditylenchus destructor]
MIPISLHSSTVLVSAAILLTILLSETKSSNALPPNYVLYLPLSLGNLPGASSVNSNIKKDELFAALSENTSGIDYWPKALTVKNPANPTPEQTTPLSPASPTTLRFRSHTHRRKHLLKYFGKSVVPSGFLKPKWTTKKVTVTTERPEIQKTTKLPRSKNPLCYFTAISCDTKYGR